MAIPTSPLAVSLPELPPLAGVRLGATAAGIRYQGRTDVVMMELAAGTTVAGVFTSNKCPGAPVDWCRGALKGRKARLLVVNAGNANVFTGRAGRDACEATAEAAAKLVGCKPREVFIASTNGDNTNLVIAQIAQKRFDVPRVVVRVLDPARAAWYAEQGLHTICPTQQAIEMVERVAFEPVA